MHGARKGKVEKGGRKKGRKKERKKKLSLLHTSLIEFMIIWMVVMFVRNRNVPTGTFRIAFTDSFRTRKLPIPENTWGGNEDILLLPVEKKSAKWTIRGE